MDKRFKIKSFKEWVSYRRDWIGIRLFMDFNISYLYWNWLPRFKHNYDLSRKNHELSLNFLFLSIGITMQEEN